MNDLNPAYVHLLTETYGKGSLKELLPNGSLYKSIDRAISLKFTEVDWLKKIMHRNLLLLENSILMKS